LHRLVLQIEKKNQLKINDFAAHVFAHCVSVKIKPIPSWK